MTECKACGAPLAQKPGEPDRDFARRSMCDRRCAARAPRLTRRRSDRWNEVAPRDCEVCHRRLEPMDGEPLRKFRVRRACGPGCRHALKQCRPTFGVLCTVNELAEALGVSYETVIHRRRKLRLVGGAE